jgi:small subunit ribosomal protein S20
LIRNAKEASSLANHKSAIKRAKQNVIRNLRNKAVRTRAKNAVKNTCNAIQGNSKEEAIAALKIAIPIIDKASGKKVIHKNTAARQISRLTRHVNALA